jgi:hypothetical protein
VEIFVTIAKGRGHRADFGVSAQSNEGRREKIEGLRFQYLARVLIALATAISYTNSLCDYTKCKPG